MMLEEFSPPDTGLKPGESVLWTRRAGMASKIMFGGGCCIVGAPWLLLVAYGIAGPSVGNVLLYLVLLVLLLTIVEFVNARRTTYYLTTERLVVTRGGFLQSQLSIVALRKAHADGNVEVKYAYEESGEEFYEVRIRTTDSGKIIRLKGLDGDAKDIILKSTDTPS
ncbi:MAG: hypothetical protein ACP6KW_01535 [Candidatus Thorarchaeota archaeon]